MMQGTMLRILLVEDHPVIGLLLADTLVHMGHEVFEVAATEAEAVAAAARDKPDLMIVDVYLNEGSGVTAMEQILRSGPVPHLFISAASLPEGSTGSLLRKPFFPHELARAISAATQPDPGPSGPASP